MEKFTNWRDKGTGISPFMPVAFPANKSIASKALSGGAKAVLFALKVPLVLVLGVLYYLTSLTVVLRLLILVVFGFNNLEVLVDGVKRSNQKKIDSVLPKVGDLVVVNYSSPLDGLFAALISQVSNWRRIALLVPDSNATHIYKYTIWSIISFTFDGKHTGQPVELTDPELASKVCFLLLEGTPSNGSAILPFLPLKNIPKTFNFKTLVVKYAPSYFSLPVPHVSKFRYFYELLSVLKIEGNFIKLKIYDFGSTFSVVEFKKSYELNSLNVVESRLNLSEKDKFWKSFTNKKDV